jgi:hypothetical protein
MKIAIFGDSWGDSETRWHTDETPWTTILENKYNIENFSESGSSLYFSANKFLSNYYKFDKIIFLVTDGSRLYMPEHSEMYHDRPWLHPYRHAKYNTPDILRQESNVNIKNNKKIADAIEMYYQYIWDNEKDVYYYSLIVSDIKSKVTADKLLILENLPAISQKEHNYYISQGYTDLDDRLSNYKEKKHCHMCQVNNNRFADLIDQWIQDPKFQMTISYTNSINPDLFYDPPLELFEKYYKKKL